MRSGECGILKLSSVNIFHAATLVFAYSDMYKPGISGIAHIVSENALDMIVCIRDFLEAATAKVCKLPCEAENVQDDC